ncbi:PREDICTED: BTB/POZ domain-containing protein KCTD9 [Rhagoletis zephyria]|uniref:BTB/POZ domain-containing protein KCTD9 n=1 Tax=Rhagoletis zephyria TaxID=28612 RepID=UPI000811A27E|nr:PREDICTED: BTB/POZ domain-containing protein KCTD9 [Rhagoletis zephyria]XP_036323446.1 BTB/POZ domain-containing protein KCTD9 [Rhagoletis pomonella]
MEQSVASKNKTGASTLSPITTNQSTIGMESATEVVRESCNKFPSSKWVKLNVGGKIYVTTLCTLVSKEPDSMLARMFSQDGMLPSEQDEQGAYLIDRSAHYFEPILNYLRHGQLIVDAHVSLEGVLEEARFFGIYSLISQLEPQLAQINRPIDDMPLTRRDVIKALIQTPHASELRFQGVNLAGADLRKLDFRNINFKYACMQRCNLSHANLTYCCLERTDLAYANLECSQLVSVKGLCANMEGANLRGCNFEDPTGVRTNLEGVNLKGACLESSNMAGINLRVANLKDANMKNCNLRSAVLAGADLERCNLSGSDLQEANLRGANLKDAELTLMVTPLHMAQAIR